MNFLKIKNWEKYQHYKDRNPPWIKLYNEILDDYAYACLQDDSKLLLITLFLLASRTENKIPADKKWIAQRGCLDKQVDWKEILSAGFIRETDPCLQDDSNVIAERLSRDRGETETETETETPPSPPSKNGHVPYSKIADRYHSRLPNLPEASLDDQLKKQIRARWKENKQRQCLEWWESYFNGVSGCDFLLGKKTDFKATLHWLTGPRNMSKVLNGQYLNNKDQSKNGTSKNEGKEYQDLSLVGYGDAVNE